MFAHAPVTSRSSLFIRMVAWTAITALVVFGLLGATAAGRTALAATSLNQSLPIAWNAASYQGDAEECADADLDPGEVLWHFVLTQTTAGVGTILHVEFSDGSSQNVAATRKTGGTLHWYVYTGQVNLTAASTTANGNNLNLSHICSGGESSSSSSSSTNSSSS